MIGSPFHVLASVDSTNNYATAEVNAGIVTSGSAYFAMEQYAGKGQRGKSWSSVPGENIILTVVLQPPLTLSQQFMLSMTVALAQHDFFSKYAGSETAIKWPNDLYWRDRKAGGTLIENILRGSQWQYAIAGMGININTPHFPPALVNPVSLKQITGKEYDSLALAQELCTFLDKRFNDLPLIQETVLRNEYKSKLFRFNEPGLYKIDGEFFTGIIRDILPSGLLQLEREGKLLELGVGEVEFVKTT
ncbi:BirA family biotin operon repressor/biotin-[acetyl-CoA-carboxylase] ligase [Chitinophaga skermanii]|uniref:BirA family biotin operon repressor/biotin-[acetyl-CoA-carboxylase] ligase n=1 Tax=Chitinophaga skermanii TaxID=331697 RepID=A0A327QIU5_9BACT|nr:biotin--[acetyl-CoA-carboxylase] ligase [Chitinophaga skermanii]RAJ03915.1 BirA family biotin operon repressor/biotin-[acetyl-CoA-carboxylase] ligase [Chitinophaga skermanii]